MKKCNKCDERGMIVDSPSPHYSAHSCPCGKHNRIMEERFNNVSMENLIIYGQGRILEKQSKIYG